MLLTGDLSRSPYGERGLKSYLRDEFTGVLRSLSLRRAWIEIMLAPPAVILHKSLSLRRAWIEISLSWDAIVSKKVALLTESVD